MKVRSRRILLLALFAAGLFGVIAMGLRPVAVEVDLATIDRGTVRETVDQDGKTRIRERYIVSAPLQGKLLRVLQDREVRPVGSNTSVKVDVRIIAATNRDLEADVASGRFRRDLYYRIAGIGLHMPTLRERPQDVPLIVGGLLKESALAGRRFSDAAMKAMRGYRWPGNVRELQNDVMRALALSATDLIETDALSPALRRSAPPRESAAPGFDPAGETLKDLIEHFEGQVIAAAMRRASSYEGLSV